MPCNRNCLFLNWKKESAFQLHHIALAAADFYCILSYIANWQDIAHEEIYCNKLPIDNYFQSLKKISERKENDSAFNTIDFWAAI